MSQDDDFSYIVLSDQYRLDGDERRYSELMQIEIDPEEASAYLTTVVTFDNQLPNDPSDYGKIFIPVAMGPMVLSGQALRDLLGPHQIGPMIATILGGLTPGFEEYGNGILYKVARLTDAAEEALQEIAIDAEELRDPTTPTMDPETYLEDLDNDELELLRAADSYDKLRAIAARIKTQPQAFVFGKLVPYLARMREELLKAS